MTDDLDLSDPGVTSPGAAPHHPSAKEARLELLEQARNAAPDAPLLEQLELAKWLATQDEPAQTFDTEPTPQYNVLFIKGRGVLRFHPCGNTHWFAAGEAPNLGCRCTERGEWKVLYYLV